MKSLAVAKCTQVEKKTTDQAMVDPWKDSPDFFERFLGDKIFSILNTRF